MLLFLISFLFNPAPLKAEWKYESHLKSKGTLNVTLKGDKEYVSVKQFCYAMSCKALYQWSSHRVFISNRENRKSALISPLTNIALIEGRVVRFKGRVFSDSKEGYVIPVELAQELTKRLNLGELKFVEDPQKIAQDKKPTFTLQRIVIDPGHGGSDFGTGLGDIYEKDICLIYAFKLKEELQKAMPSTEVFLTREDDKYVSLPDRAKFANGKEANLFLSLHVNHAQDLSAQGQETYILSPDATDDEARKVALLENDTWLKSASIQEAAGNVKKILVDMEQTKYIQSSALAASMISQEVATLEKVYGLKSRGVKQAMFYVLSQVAMPSTLVEMAFLSNTGDRGRLMDIKFRDDFVKSLVLALKRYKSATL